MSDLWAPPVEVVRDAVATQGTQALAETVRDHGSMLLSPEGRPLLEEALTALPPELVESDPALLSLRAMLRLLEQRVEDAVRMSAAAESLQLALPPSERDELVTDRLLVMQLWRARSGWYPWRDAVANARERLGCRHDVPGAAHPLAVGQSPLWAALVMAELATLEIIVGELPSARVHTVEIVYRGRALQHEWLLSMGLSHRSMVELLDGRYQSAAGTARASLEAQPPGGELHLPYLARSHWVIAWAAVYELDLETARHGLEAAESHLGRQFDPVLSELLTLLRARLLVEEGRIGDAQRLLAQQGPAEALAPHLARIRATVVAQVAAMAADDDGIRQYADLLRAHGYDVDARLFEGIADLGRCRNDLALAAMEEVAARTDAHPTVRASAHALRVGVLLKSGRRGDAAAAMPDLLTRVAAQRLLQTLRLGFAGGPEFLTLLEEEAARPDAHLFAAEALAGVGGYARIPPESLPVARSGALTRRENDVLRELARGGSYVDVARALFISENTVKTHLAAVYRKLGVERRPDALRVARERGLL